MWTRIKSREQLEVLFTRPHDVEDALLDLKAIEFFFGQERHVVPPEKSENSLGCYRLSRRQSHGHWKVPAHSPVLAALA